VFSVIAPDHRFETSYGGYGAFTGRLGVAVDRALFYAKGGLAVARIKNEALDDFPTPDPEHIGRSDTTRFGWAVGGGMEYALTNNWIIRGEYLYMQFDNKTVFDLGDGNGVLRRRAPIPSTTICTRRAWDWPTSSEVLAARRRGAWSLNCKIPGKPGFLFGLGRSGSLRKFSLY
jgi:hypothetical protein